jgi:arsenite/tail-anchored protein-transporting ATPase
VTSKPRRSARSPIRKPVAPENDLTSTRYLFFGGKGGVGKTTAAAATSLFLLKHARPDDAILLFSTDPAHSLSDSLGLEVGNSLVEVKRHKGASLFAYEMNASLALERFRQAHDKTLAEIAERGTLLDEADINELLHLSLPGLDEVMSLFELSELDRAATYRHIVVDTAPSGHTSRLLRLPDVFARMVNALDRMGDKHRYMVAHFARRKLPADKVDLFLRDLRERIDRVGKMLYDKEQTRFTLVAIPEAMSVSETERYYSLLKNEGVPVTDLVINRVEVEHRNCPYCQARVSTQRPWLKEISKSFENLKFHYLSLMPSEVRGLEALQSVGEQIWNTKTSAKRVAAHQGKPAQKAVPAKSTKPSFQFESRRIVMFGGKGGVGKTTAAAAFAIALAKSDPKERVLIFSTDPAHSLSDSFKEQIGELKKGVGAIANLDAMEIDPGLWFESLKQRYRIWIDNLFASLAGDSKLEIKFDREAMRELVELTPPGIDEIAALGTISDLIEEDRYHTIVLDTAPTGHLIRFLELPQSALSWIRTFIKLLLKYQTIVRATEVAEELVSLSKNIKRVLALLTDPEQCEFVGVAIPERMSLEETVDLSTSLVRLKVSMQRLLINGVVPADAGASCSFCQARRAMQEKSIKEFAKKLGGSTSLYVAAQQPNEIRGVKLLVNHFNGWQLLQDTVETKTRSTLKSSKTINERKRTSKRVAARS